MKVLQIIDSLHPGGAERMAVTYANLLQEQGIKSHLCCTREEGLLKENLNAGVKYIFLKKKSATDLQAVFKLKKFIKEHEIDLLHAHGTSFFTATIQKIFKNDLKIVWHDHYGKSEELEQRKFSVLKKCSSFFDAIFSVNQDLKKWAEVSLNCGNVFYIKNFIAQVEEQNTEGLVLKAENSVKIICLANFREQKNHFLLLESFRSIRKNFPNVSLHLVGKNWDDLYFSEVKKLMDSEEEIYFYGSQSNIKGILSQADIGVLSSNSEGLPMAILEYAQAGLAVVCTNVGQCEEVINGFGKTVPPKDANAFANAILNYLENPEQRKNDATLLQEHVQENYSGKAVLPQILEIYKNPLS